MQNSLKSKLTTWAYHGTNKAFGKVVRFLYSSQAPICQRMFLVYYVTRQNHRQRIKLRGDESSANVSPAKDIICVLSRR